MNSLSLFSSAARRPRPYQGVRVKDPVKELLRRKRMKTVEMITHNTQSSHTPVASHDWRSCDAHLKGAQWTLSLPASMTTSEPAGPVFSTPACSTPACSTPACSTPACSTPACSTPVFSTPACSTSAFSTPVFSTPACSTPVFSTPACSTPVFSTPACSTPVFSTPVFSTPVFSTPAFSTPAFSTPAYSTPALTTLACSTPALSTLTCSTPVFSTPACSTPVFSTPALSTPACSTPVFSTPALSTPACSTPDDQQQSTQHHMTSAVAMPTVCPTCTIMTPLLANFGTLPACSLPHLDLPEPGLAYIPWSQALTPSSGVQIVPRPASQSGSSMVHMPLSVSLSTWVPQQDVQGLYHESRNLDTLQYPDQVDLKTHNEALDEYRGADLEAPNLLDTILEDQRRDDQLKAKKSYSTSIFVTNTCDFQTKYYTIFGPTTL
ncbi:keratin-associated protein 16-1-like [Nerophis ophidion]|uniref:keratin-associated protein 16-1-like n=1 Tax=Nerophis ophidion TaxID=159077 RepID=UPI002ADF2961|nr:keratin-associated protein 16-1-like [Nerophis ophidion]